MVAAGDAAGAAGDVAGAAARGDFFAERPENVFQRFAIGDVFEEGRFGRDAFAFAIGIDAAPPIGRTDIARRASVRVRTRFDGS